MKRPVCVPGDEQLERFEALLGHAFGDRTLLLNALVHGSSKATSGEDNERLEFLGDAVLGAVVSSRLYETYPDFQEGRMTKVRSQVVSRRNLALRARGLSFDRFVIVGRMFRDRDTIADSILSNAFEAVIGAVFLDGGWGAARDFVLRHLDEDIRQAALDPGRRDYKSLLGEWAQQQLQENPVYRLISTSGPDHTRVFEVAARVGGRSFPTATGSSKKEAEQEAARLALLELALL